MIFTFDGTSRGMGNAQMLADALKEHGFEAEVKMERIGPRDPDPKSGLMSSFRVITNAPKEKVIEISDSIEYSRPPVKENREITLSEFKKLLSEQDDRLAGRSTYDMQDAYSFGRVGHVIGDAILEACLDAGYSLEQAESIFRSKNTRWFMDEKGSEFGKLAKRLFREYIQTNKRHINKMLKDEIERPGERPGLPKEAIRG
jgi:hypothetical protein